MRGSTTTTPLRRAVPPRCLTLLTVQEAANYASVSKQTVRRWISAGDLPVLRAPRQIRIDESDLLAYLHRARPRLRSGRQADVKAVWRASTSQNRATLQIQQSQQLTRARSANIAYFERG